MKINGVVSKIEKCSEIRDVLKNTGNFPFSLKIFIYLCIWMLFHLMSHTYASVSSNIWSTSSCWTLE